PARGIGSRPRRALGTDPGAHPDGAGPPGRAAERGMKRTIAVDLTPVLPGGDNGGAKIFVLELLRTLAAMRPDHEFVLLTQAASHDELAHLDRPNMRRHLAVGTAVGEAVRPRLHRLGARVFAHMPVRLRRVAFGVAYRVDRAMKRGGARGLLRE